MGKCPCDVKLLTTTNLYLFQVLHGFVLYSKAIDTSATNAGNTSEEGPYYCKQNRVPVEGFEKYDGDENFYMGTTLNLIKTLPEFYLLFLEVIIQSATITGNALQEELTIANRIGFLV